ncbi:MAG: elongation factor G [Calditrichia bacterium]|nr:elongation factor G [Calditrichota bacterium]MCB0267485.1 elongation factor G [Calditrichota bacterium]MCB9067853.1 elongation factor G [Calditrichia bacterium]
MKVYTGEHIRNVGVGGHSGSGKTSLVEAMLFNMGEVNRIGSIEQGNTVSDYNEDEIERQISINSSLLHGEWNNNKVNLVDTPGFSDFYGDVVSGMRAADSVMIVVSAANGVEVGTERVRQLAELYDMPRFYVINKLDRENVQFMKVAEELRDRFGKQVTILQLPLESGPGFHVVVDILKKKAYTYEQDGSGKFTVGDIPANVMPRVEELRLELVESVAESDDELLEKYFDAGELTEEQLMTGFINAVKNRTIVPMLCASSTANIGVANVMDFIVEFLPSADRIEVSDVNGKSRSISDNNSLSTFVFQTVAEAHMGELSLVKVISGVLKSGDEVLNTANDKTERIGQIYLLNGKQKKNVDQLHAGDIAALVKMKYTHTGNTLSVKNDPFILPKIDFPEPLINMAVEPKTKGDEDKLSTGLHTLHEEDPTFMVHYDPELRQTIVSAQGELHLMIILKRLSQRFGVEVEMSEPRIPYRETIRTKAEAQGKFKKQSGGRGQYGDCHLRLEPKPRGEGFEFVDAIVGGVIPGKFIPAVEKGAFESCENGVLAGYPIVDIKVTVFYGSYHNVDSSEMAFKVAASMGFKKAFMDAKPVLLEPIYQLEIKVPEAYMGDVMGDISSRRGKIQGMDADGRFQVIKALVPLAELHKYSTVLRSMTQGQGLFHRNLSHYEEVPSDVAQKIIDAAEKEKEEA